MNLGDPAGSPLEMHQRDGKAKYAALREDSSTATTDSNKDDTRWHEGELHNKKQHFHHLTLPNLEDIETDDAEFIDDTEGLFIKKAYYMIHI